MNDFTPDQVAYLKWVRDNYPLFYADNVQPYLSHNGLGNIGAPNQFLENAGLAGFEDILTSITDALPKLGQTYADYATGQAALQQKTMQIAATTRSSTSNYLPYILGGVALLGIAFIATR